MVFLHLIEIAALLELVVASEAGLLPDDIVGELIASHPLIINE